MTETFTINRESFLENFRGLVAMYRIKPMAAEQRVVGQTPSGDHYTGTADLIAHVNGKMAVIDLKTGRGRSPMHGVQIAAYAHALGLSHGHVMYLSDYGEPSLVEVDVELGISIFDKMLQTYMALLSTNLQPVILEAEKW